MKFPTWVDAGEGGGVESSSESEEEDEHPDPVEYRNLELDVLDQIQDADGMMLDAGPSTSKSKKAGKLSIKLSTGGGAVCHVCGKSGHFSGFVGSIYLDCINKPCYLCGKSGHRTGNCPHRIAPELGCSAAADVATTSIIQYLLQRERQGVSAGRHSLPPNPPKYNVDAAIVKLHARRTTCLEFHPTRDDIVISGDKHGQIALWDYNKVFERTVYTDMNKWCTNAVKFMPASSSNLQAVTASYDGAVKVVDLEVGVQVKTLVDANPLGWAHVQEQDKCGKWVTFIGLDVMPSSGTVVAGDSTGRVSFLDPRIEGAAAVIQAHKKKSKVQSVSVNPAAETLILSAGNDYQARLLDARFLGGGASTSTASPSTGTTAGIAAAAEIMSFPHPRVINAAYFSPLTGRKILTTCQDNRLRVWDSFALGNTAPNREIVHSHTFNRHLTAFRAEWDPKDSHERLACIGRYISEDYGGVALHPVDLIDVATGASVGALVDPNLTTICPVNKPHPRVDVLVTGSSTSLYVWRPENEEEDGEDEGGRGPYNDFGEGSSDNGNKGAGGSFSLRGSSNYMFYDADDKAASKKKAAKRGNKGGEATTTTTTMQQKKGKRKKEDQEEESDDGED